MVGFQLERKIKEDIVAKELEKRPSKEDVKNLMTGEPVAGALSSWFVELV